MSLAEKIRASRRLEIQVGDAVFYARRPTYEELGQLFWDKATNPEIARRFVTGWRNVRAKDLFADGSDDLVEFDREVWNEAAGDLKHATGVIADRLVKESHEYQEKAETERKN